jgi:hypothetical protein
VKKTPIDLMRRLTSRKRRSTALVAVLRHARILSLINQPKRGQQSKWLRAFTEYPIGDKGGMYAVRRVELLGDVGDGPTAQLKKARTLSLGL